MKPKRAPRLRTTPVGRTDARTALPTVLHSHDVETQSRTLLRAALSPWLVIDNHEHDYGIDMFVEITRTRTGDPHLDATGKRIAVQLRATEQHVDGSIVGVPVKVNHVRYWLASTERVLLVHCELPHGLLRWRWIDDQLISDLNRADPSWIARTTVTIPVPGHQMLDIHAKEAIASIAGASRQPRLTSLVPGAYFRCLEAAKRSADRIAAAAKESGFESPSRRLASLAETLRGATYIVAITGPSRAGKSTLLNALVAREVSPVGRLPTTAVAMLITAGEADGTEVSFLDGRRVSGPASADFLAEYATLERNPDNEKGIRIITVRLVSEVLERGIEYADAPGLHDPSQAIRDVTAAALRSADAILYVIDAAPARHGGFSLNQYVIEDLQRLGTAVDDLFLVINKADALDDAERAQVDGYIERELRRYKLADRLKDRTAWASAKHAWDGWTSPTRDRSAIAPLEDRLWNHLLSSGSTGAMRLARLLPEMERAANEFLSILAARQQDGSYAAELRRRLQVCSVERERLVRICRRHVRIESRLAAQRLRLRTEEAFNRLAEWLAGVPSSQQLPASAVVQQWLQQAFVSAIDVTWRETGARMVTLSGEVAFAVEQSLLQARLATTTGGGLDLKIPSLPDLGLLPSDSLQEAWTGMLAAGLLGALLATPWTALIAVGGWLTGLVFGTAARRRREIERLVSRSRSAVESAVRETTSTLEEKIASYLGNLEHNVEDRVSVFVHDVERQLAKLGSPITPGEARRLAELERDVRDAIAELCGVLEQVRP